MADLTRKKRASAFEFMQSLEALKTAVETAATIAAEINAAQISYVDADFLNDDGMAHLSGELITAALLEFDYTNPAGLVYYLTAGAQPPVQVLLAQMVP